MSEDTDRILAEIGRLRGEVMARMDRIQNDVTALRDDIAVGFAAADHVRRMHDNTREEGRGLGDVISAMQRQIQRLQADVRALRDQP
jgi:hypothetical protein